MHVGEAMRPNPSKRPAHGRVVAKKAARARKGKASTAKPARGGKGAPVRKAPGRQSAPKKAKAKGKPAAAPRPSPAPKGVKVARPAVHEPKSLNVKSSEFEVTLDLGAGHLVERRLAAGPWRHPLPSSAPKANQPA